MARLLKYRGIEAWLEGKKGEAILLTAPPVIDKESRTMSTVVHLEPKAAFTLHWRRATGLEPISALCHVFIQNGFFSVNVDDFCLAGLTMDKNRRVSQSRSTFSHLNPPYKRHGQIKMGRKCDYSPTISKSDHYPSDSVLRLEIRRIQGKVCNPVWVTGSDDLETSVIDLDETDIIDDENKGMLPFVVFEFEFPDIFVPAVQDMGNQPPTLVKFGTSHLKHSSRKESTTTDCDLGSRSGIHDTLVGSTSYSSLSQAEASRSKAINSFHSPVVVDDLDKEDRKPTALLLDGAASGGKRKTREWDDPIKSSITVVKPIVVNGENSMSDINLTADYHAVDQLEKELCKKLAKKIKMKQTNIEELRRLLASE